MAEKNAMLVMRDVSKTFNPGTVNEKCALKNLNLTLKQGDFATIVGSNGAGKSTLFNAITGVFFADKGLIMLDGEDITYQKEHVRSKVIGHLFQDPLKGTAPHMTIEENMAEKNAMLVMRDVSKTFNPGTVNEKCALKNLNLTLKQGDFATIVGSNGAGKSTLFNAITGVFFADKGLIMLDGEDITYQKEHVRSKVIGHLFQDPLKGTAPHMTIEENMALAYLRTTTSKNAYFSRIKAADKKKFREQLALLDMGLEDRMKQPVGLLSGGQRQALTLLMATMVTPKILLLDEHTAALDPATAEKVLNLTKKIVSEQNITCLMVTHNMHQALELGNRTLMMDSGNIVLDVSGEEREKMSVDDLLEQFAVRAGKALDNDRILFSKVEA